MLSAAGGKVQSAFQPHTCLILPHTLLAATDLGSTVYSLLLHVSHTLSLRLRTAQYLASHQALLSSSYSCILEAFLQRCQKRCALYGHNTRCSRSEDLVPERPEVQMCAWRSYESTHSSGMRRLSKELGMSLVSSALLV